MTDIVERLRNPPIRIKHGGYAEASGVELDQFEVLALLANSADEIEHLREVLYWLAQEETPYPIGQPYQHWLDKARAALSKARGET